MPRLLQGLITLFSILGCGCPSFVVGDSVIVAKGKLAFIDKKVDFCVLDLLSEENEVPVPYKSLNLKEGDFYTGFTVSQNPQKYRLKLSCLGYTAIEKSVYPKESLIQVDFGIVTIGNGMPAPLIQ